jgi:hypothetical protein
MFVQSQILQSQLHAASWEQTCGPRLLLLLRQLQAWLHVCTAAAGLAYLFDDLLVLERQLLASLHTKHWLALCSSRVTPARLVNCKQLPATRGRSFASQA